MTSLRSHKHITFFVYRKRERESFRDNLCPSTFTNLPLPFFSLVPSFFFYKVFSIFRLLFCSSLSLQSSWAGDRIRSFVDLVLQLGG
ncbi:hypothetical protein RIF29_31463 [Crotalaria pallida]|uniref:Uncharacterized protein n=1 Tax=Crotalaria pallida TaxID=3830 RepID=A0AAN9EH87_CROPI